MANTQPKIEPVTESELTRALEALPGWEQQNHRLQKTFRFKNFNQAFAFMAQVALLAEKMDHHPDWSNSYNVVTITLFTHTIKQISALDLQLAQQIEAL